MALQTVAEKLLLKDEKNILIQGLPSSVEKQFSKITFAKNVTPLLRTRGIEFGIVFAVSHKHLNDMLIDVVPALRENAKFWVAYPKKTAKIASDLSRETNWDEVIALGYEVAKVLELDSVWNAARFRKLGAIDVDDIIAGSSEDELDEDIEEVMVAPKKVVVSASNIDVPDALQKQLNGNKEANETFESLAPSHRKEYIEWILSAKKDETRMKRIYTTIEKLAEGKRTHSQK